jgi:chloramphenicol O-acetyltransferase type B
MIIDTIKALVRPIRKRLGWLREQELAHRYPQYKIGQGTYGDLTVRSWNAGTTLTIGAYTSVAAGVKVFLGGEHRIDWVTTYPFNVLWEPSKHHKGHPKTKGNVAIGNDVWIGTEALILSGVTIGDGAVIGARAVITRDVPPYAVVAGNPAKVIKYRFDESVIARLLAIQWWNWTRNEIEKAMPDLLSTQMVNFLEKAERGDYK